jgi:hypothetical protein
VRRPIPLALAAILLATACGSERLAATPGADTSSSPTPTAAPEPPRTLESFPLSLGYDATNGDDGSPVTVTDRPATTTFEECGHEVWDPGSGVETAGVEFRGEAEWYRGRTLVLHPTADAAATAVDASLAAIEACPRDRESDAGHTAHTLVDYRVGEQSFGWIDRYWSADANGFDTGLTVYHVVRVGRAVLLSYEYGEGNGTDDSRHRAIEEAATLDHAVVDAMVGLSAN